MAKANQSSDIKTLFADGERVALKRGATLLSPGEGESFAWLISSGSIKQYDIQSNGSAVTVNVYKPGAILSLTWLLGESPNRYFFSALETATLHKIPAETFRTFLSDNPSYALAMLTRLSRGLDGIFMRLSVNSTNDAELRVMTELCLEAARFGRQNGTHVQVKIPTKELAARTGMSPETVSRTLTKLITKGHIGKQGSVITILGKSD